MVPTCEECTGGVEAVSGIIGMESTIAEIMTFLKVKIALQTVRKSLKTCGVALKKLLVSGHN